MDLKSIEKDNFIDLEGGLNKSDENVDLLDISSSEGGENMMNEGFGKTEKVGADRLREKKRRKPRKPPRAPKSLTLDATDTKFVQHLSKLAILKRARIERMKALKKIKNNKNGSFSSSLCSLVITVLFCAIIFWKGVFSTNNSRLNVSTTTGPTAGGVVEFRSNLSSGPLHSSFSRQVSKLHHGQGEAMRLIGRFHDSS